MRGRSISENFQKSRFFETLSSSRLKSLAAKYCKRANSRQITRYFNIIERLFFKQKKEQRMPLFLKVVQTANYFAAAPQAGTTVCINGFNIFNEHANT